MSPVQALARRLHVEFCLPGSNPYHLYSPAHHDGHERAAGRIVADLAADGLHLSGTGEQQ